ncbi:MAG: hypothetical protein EOM69_09280 [Clostridia bacterium]|nr:hypothetical protein [Clostridia bacterium]
MTRRSFPKSFAMLAIVICLLFVATSCQPVGSPEDTIHDFQNAYNQLDMNKALECFEPSQAEAFKSLINIFSGSLINVSAQDLINILPLFSNVRLDENGTTFGSVSPKIAITIHSTTVNGNNATCAVTMVMTSGGETLLNQDGECTLVLQNGKWYIRDLQ